MSAQFLVFLLVLINTVDLSLSLSIREIASFKSLVAAWHPKDWTGDPSLACNWSGVGCNSNGNVVWLILTNYSLQGTIPNDIDGFTMATGIYLDQNQLEGTLPNSLGNLTQLNDDLVFSYNRLSGTLPSSLGRLTLMVKLDVSNNYLSGTIPTTFGGMVRMQQLWLHSNFFSGSIPGALGQLKTVGELFLQNNLLSGSLPDGLRGATSLINFQVQNNSLSGVLTTDYFSGLSISVLNVSYNSFSGTLPALVPGFFSSFYDFSWNSFSGTIPDSYWKVHYNLASFNATNNFLSGQVPSWICNMTWGFPLWQSYDLRGNNFTCPLPSCCGFDPGNGLCLNNATFPCIT